MPLERPVAAVARPVLLAGAVRIEWRCHTFSTLFCVRVLPISDRNRGCMQPAGARAGEPADSQTSGRQTVSRKDERGRDGAEGHAFALVWEKLHPSLDLPFSPSLSFSSAGFNVRNCAIRPSIRRVRFH